MFRSLPDLLWAIAEKEQKVIEEQEIQHGPTIGEMYEGLAKNLVDRAIPSILDLQLVSGFATDSKGNLSREIDCMLVRGQGTPIPYTNSFKWHIKDVIAVFEIKKNLFFREMDDGYKKMLVIKKLLEDYAQNEGREEFLIDRSKTATAFALVTGIYPENFEEVNTLALSDQQIYFSIFHDQCVPLRIIFGYDGYTDEYALRKAFIRYLELNPLQEGFGVPSLPNMIVCGRKAIVKLNGYPYWVKKDNGWWHVLGSTCDNPLIPLIEILWARLSLLADIILPSEDDLDEEWFYPLLLARAREFNGRVGWEYLSAQPGRSALRARPVPKIWEPTVISIQEFVFLNILIKAGSLRKDDEEISKYLSDRGLNKDNIIAKLTDKGLVSSYREFLRPTRDGLVFIFTPKGNVVAGHDGRVLSLWVEKNMRDDNV